MNRRESLKSILGSTVALAILPSWANGWTRDTVRLSESFFSSHEQGILASVADTIIPAGNSIGSLSVGVDKFLEKLLANCYEQEIQLNVKKQLVELDDKANTTYSKPFAQLDQSARQKLLISLADSSEEDQRNFFELIKKETIRGFSTSKEVMLNYQKYKVVPGHYRGCVDITT